LITYRWFDVLDLLASLDLPEQLSAGLAGRNQMVGAVVEGSARTSLSDAGGDSVTDLGYLIPEVKVLTVDQLQVDVSTELRGADPDLCTLELDCHLLMHLLCLDSLLLSQQEPFNLALSLT
jgi:hypothetical protein